MFLFADDAKLFRHINNKNDQLILQKGCDELQNWTDKWSLSLNTDKCKVLTIIKQGGNYVDHKYSLGKNKTELEHIENIKDLGITIDGNLKFNEHIADKINKSYRMIGLIKRNFKSMDKNTILLLYKSLVRSQLEYGNSVWSPHNKGIIKDLEKVQKRATKLIYQCKDMNYSERLQYLKLPTLLYRRHRGDMIEVFKILTGKYDCDIVPDLNKNNNTITRGNIYILKTNRTTTTLRKFTFSNRIVNIWNLLTDEVVSADTKNI